MFTGAGVSGMALAYAISSLVNAVLLVFLLNRKIAGLGVLGGLRLFFVKTGGAALGMSAALVALGRVTPGGFLSGPFSAALKIRQVMLLGINAVAGVLIYFGLLLLFRLPEAGSIAGSLRDELRKRLPGAR
jgi:putative peptidoglycan lipid II flippase